MSDAVFVADDVPERFVEVDAARLLLVLEAFAHDASQAPPDLLATLPEVPARHFTPEYLLQKLDFLMRYPRHLAYELAELHRLGIPSAADQTRVIEDVRRALSNKEPEFRTQAYRKFWRGAYERLDLVESWWLSRRLVFVRSQRRGDASPQKHYLLTAAAGKLAVRLPQEVEHARWYADRAALLRAYFGGMSAGTIRSLQYELPGYREAQVGALIPDVSDEDLRTAFRRAFGRELEDADG
jgi:hypothetical protein